MAALISLAAWFCLVGLVLGVGLMQLGVVALRCQAGLLAGANAHIRALLILAAENMPLILVTLWTVRQGHSALAMGVVAGAYVAQLLGVLPATALLRPLVFNKNICTRLIPFHIIVGVCYFFFSIDAVWSRWDGLIFLLLAFAYATIVMKPFILDRPPSAPLRQRNPAITLLLAVAAWIALGLGAVVSVFSTQALALRWHLSPAWLGLSWFAVALVIPSLLASARAARSGQMAAAVGPVLQRSVLGLLLALGISGTLLPFPIFGALHSPQTWDYWAVFLSGLLLLAAIGLKAPRRLGPEKSMGLLALWTLWLGLRFMNGY